MLVVGVGAFIVAVYRCVGKRRTERAERACTYLVISLPYRRGVLYPLHDG